MTAAEGAFYRPTCVIAGAGPRLGLAIAERYAEEGFAAFSLCRRPAELEPGIAALRARRLSVSSLSCDVSNEVSVRAALRRIRQEAGGCDVLIYNAFSDDSGSPTTLDSETILKDFRVNVAGALAFVKLTIGDMRARGGAVLFSGCGLARQPSAQRTSLSVGKAALRALVDCLAAEIEPQGIRVGMVTVEGAMPAGAADLKNVADLYWRLFVTSESRRRRELRFRSSDS